MNYKTPLELEEQIEYLKSTKRVVFNRISQEEAKTILAKYGYINVITPFKYKFALRDKDGNAIKDQNGNHQYIRDVDFGEYYDQYIRERKDYKQIYHNISAFETTFNAVVSHNVINFHNINSDDSFDTYKTTAVTNICNSKYKTPVQDHMIAELEEIGDNIKKYKSVFIAFDRLSLNQTITVFRSCDPLLQKRYLIY